ncbi:1,2-dihydroxy-3-keto-5-methylthiopentene dioxygenase [Dimargaris xerosporica]|nr:1,2-dihydroxy-3-keto-5-methylthiopentene dioxygenase [Dimargaris xerosporica]
MDLVEAYGPASPQDPQAATSGALTFSRVVHYLQAEWRRFDLERNEWAFERKEFVAHIHHLEQQHQATERTIDDLHLEIKRLQQSTKKRRFKPITKFKQLRSLGSSAELHSDALDSASSASLSTQSSNSAKDFAPASPRNPSDYALSLVELRRLLERVCVALVQAKLTPAEFPAAKELVRAHLRQIHRIAWEAYSLVPLDSPHPPLAPPERLDGLLDPLRPASPPADLPPTAGAAQAPPPVPSPVDPEAPNAAASVTQRSTTPPLPAKPQPPYHAATLPTRRPPNRPEAETSVAYDSLTLTKPRSKRRGTVLPFQLASRSPDSQDPPPAASTSPSDSGLPGALGREQDAGSSVLTMKRFMAKFLPPLQARASGGFTGTLATSPPEETGQGEQASTPPKNRVDQIEQALSTSIQRREAPVPKAAPETNGASPLDLSMEDSAKNVGPAQSSLSSESNGQETKAEMVQVGDHHYPVWSLHGALYGHLDPVRAIDVDPASHLVLTGSDDGVIKLWDLDHSHTKPKHRRKSPARHQPLLTLRGSIHQTTSVVYASSEQRCYAGGLDGSIRVWDIPDAAQAATASDLSFHTAKVDGHHDVVWEMALMPESASGTRRPQLLASISADQTCCVWNTTNLAGPAELRLTYNPATSSGPPPQTALVTPTAVTFPQTNPNHLIVGYRDASIRTYDVARGDCLHHIALEQVSFDGAAAVNKVTTFAHEPLLVAGLEDGTIRLIDLRLGQCVHQFTGHQAAVTAVDIDFTGHCLVSASHDCSLRWWDQRSYTCVLEYSPHRRKHGEGVVCMRAHPHLPWVLTGGADAVVKVFTTTTDADSNPGLQEPHQ